MPSDGFWTWGGIDEAIEVIVAGTRNGLEFTISGTAISSRSYESRGRRFSKDQAARRVGFVVAAVCAG
jgi:hypothetical protein